MLCVAGHRSKILPIASSKIYPKRLSELKAGDYHPRLFSCPRGFRELGMPETHFPRMAARGSSVNSAGSRSYGRGAAPVGPGAIGPGPSATFVASLRNVYAGDTGPLSLALFNPGV